MCSRAPPTRTVAGKVRIIRREKLFTVQLSEDKFIPLSVIRVGMTAGRHGVLSA